MNADSSNKPAGEALTASKHLTSLTPNLAHGLRAESECFVILLQPTS